MKKKLYLSLIFNLMIFLLGLLGTFLLMFDVKFMLANSRLTYVKWYIFHFFTVESNMLISIVALVYAVYDILLLKQKVDTIPTWLSALKLTATTCVALTLITVLCFLAPLAAISGKDGLGYWSLFLDGYLLFHFIVPLTAVCVFLLSEPAYRLKRSATLFSLVPVGAYGVYYLINVLTHSVDGKVSPKYDWYYFVQGGLWQIVIFFPLMVGAAYLIGLLLWALNRRISS